MLPEIAPHRIPTTSRAAPTPAFLPSRIFDLTLNPQVIRFRRPALQKPPIGIRRISNSGPLPSKVFAQCCFRQPQPSFDVPCAGRLSVQIDKRTWTQLEHLGCSEEAQGALLPLALHRIPRSSRRSRVAGIPG